MKYLIILYIALLNSSLVATPLPSPESVEAYKHYWNSFDQYEERRINESKETISQAWDQLKKDIHIKRRSMSEQQLSSLKDAAKQYRSHIEKHSDAENAPYVLLNLAQILQKIGDHYQEFDVAAGTQYRSEALEVLSEITKRFPDFEKRGEVLYLRATSLDAISQKESALKVWRTLASTSQYSIYKAHAHIAVGDNFFYKEKSKSALAQYERALASLESIQSPDIDYELLRVKYRIAWSSYRSAELKKCITVAIDILEPGRPLKKISTKTKIEDDAVELIGDALYEYNDDSFIKVILKRKVLRNYASAVSLRILKRYMSGSLYKDSISLGEFVLKSYPRAKHIPDILTILAQSYEKTSNQEGRLQALERLSLMLPRNSLWRRQYKDDYSLIKNMETKAIAATKLLAAHYYKIGMVNASISSFLTGTSYYEALIKFDPNNSEANQWRLKQGHAYFFSSKLGKAKKVYENLINDQKVSQKTLQLASYQLVLTFEKIWRKEYGTAIEKNQDPSMDPIVMQHLKDFEESADAFSNRFPTSRFSVESLLKAASANRDMKNNQKASKYWQRSLISSPESGQRAFAIRGIVYRKVQAKNPQNLIETVTRFLKLEDWRVLSSPLRTELLGILSQAIRNYSDELNEAGRVLEAGRMIIKQSNDFPSIPKHNSLYRDAVYMLAIGGEWSEALKYANLGLDIKGFKFKGDLAYLKARSLEYQLRFLPSAQAYLDMGRKYKRHSRSETALNKSVILAKAENNLTLAAAANIQLAKKSKTNKSRFRYYANVSDLYYQLGKNQESLKYGKLALKFSSSRDQNLSQRLSNAKNRFALGSQESALKEFRKLSLDAQKFRDRIDYKTYQDIRGESNFILAEELRERFIDFRVAEQKRHWKYHLKDKVKLFERVFSNYSTAISSRHPEWSSKSRFRLGQAAETFSYEINEALMNDEKMAPNEREDIHKHAIRFKKLAKKLYSENIMERNRSPKTFRNNPWIKKSKIKLSGYHHKDLLNIDDDRLPYSINSTMPSQWSM